MNKSQGFTLIELLAVIVVLAIIATIGGIGISSVIDTSEQEAYKQQVANIIKASKEWVLENTNELPNSGSICVSLNTLYNAGKFGDSFPVNPTNSEVMNGSVLISCIGTNCHSYKYTYSNSSYGCK